MRIASFFAGVGGIELGLRGQVVYANEIDKNAVTTYELNHKIKVDNRDISVVDEKVLRDFDMLIGGFPCQAFSIAGYRKGFLDDRGNMFFELMRIARHKRPKIMLLENVKNLVGHDGGKTFAIMLEAMEDLGYHVKYKVLNAMEYSDTPQNRERIYIVAFLDRDSYYKFEFPKPFKRVSKIGSIVDFNEKVDEKYYYTDKFNNYSELKKEITKKDTLYQYISNSHLYKQAGNSVCVKVIKRIGDEIARAVNLATT